MRFGLQAISVGIWLGAIAGVATGTCDFGAHWLFMESSADRGWLLLRLLSTQVPACALLGGLGGAAYALIATALARYVKSIQARRLAFAGAYLALALPLILSVARLLFTGGHMARVAHRAVLHGSCIALLIGGLVSVLYVGQVVFERARRAQPTAARRTFLVLFLLAFGLAKLNQLFLPGLYDYLHAVLSASSASLYALSAALAAARAWDAGLLADRRLLFGGLGLGALLVVTLRLSLDTLDQNQNVRVALLSANMPHSRSLLLGLAPLLPAVDARSAELARIRAQRARTRRAQTRDMSDLLTLEGAHVLLITVDALRADQLGVYGGRRQITSEIDALAARGVVFEHAYAQAPHSSYSLCSLMTSQYLHETLDLGQPPPEATLPRVLSAAGYHTAAFYTQGIFHTAGEQLAVYENNTFGFALHEHQDRPAEEMTDRVLAEIDRTVARGEPSALFWVHYFDVHEPYEATTLGSSDFDRYDSEILATDRAIGRLVRLAQQRLHKNLIVVITADHGEEFHEHGGVYHGSSLYEEQVRVPLIVLAKGVAARRVAAPVESIDITPTLLALVGADKAETMHGADLRGLMLGHQKDRGPVFSAVIHKKMVVSWPYKLIADLRFGSYELYNLERDPSERDNLADRDPALLQTLRGEVYAWIDSLSPPALTRQTPAALALEWGRLGDRRAVKPLCTLMLDEHASVDTRREAARLLGKLADESAADSLFSATKSSSAWVAAEAAMALGRLFDLRAAAQLRKLVVTEDPELRSRAAISLGRLRDPAAVPALIDALWIAPSGYEREEAVRWLGRLRDPRALEPLLRLLPEAHTRHLVVVALGELGDQRALTPLTQVLVWDRNTNVRDGVVHGLGALGDARALDTLVPLASEEPELRNTGESLVRLRALERGAIGGADLTRDHAGSLGFGACYAGPLRHDWDFLHRTSCTTLGPSAWLRLLVPSRVAKATSGAVAVLSIKRVDGAQPAQLRVKLGDTTVAELQVDGAWREYRFMLTPEWLAHGDRNAVLVSDVQGARFEVDHLLLVPRTTSDALAAHGG